MGLDVRMNVSVSDTGGGGGKWRAPKDDIIQVVKPKGAKRISDPDEVGIEFSEFLMCLPHPGL